MGSRQNGASPIGVALVGLGTVGTGVYKVLQNHPQVKITGVAVRNLNKPRTVEPDCLMGADPFFWKGDLNCQIVVEVIGGVTLAKTILEEAIREGKHVVTANKELIAKHGAELFALAEKHGVRVLFEGAVAGGIPILMPLKLSLSANRIEAIAGIVNGTTNYILTKMSQEGWSYPDALAQAQKLGFAEADPTSDVEGYDARYKISILAALAFQQQIDVNQVFCQGITTITPMDIQQAASLGYVIKLIGLARQAPNGVDVRVHPMLVPQGHPLAAIQNEFNAVWVRGDAVGEVMFYGRGAGELPTGSAVCGDVLAIANDLCLGNDPMPAMAFSMDKLAHQVPISETTSKYYIRLNTADLPGVIGNLGKACGEYGVSLESVLQRCTNSDGTASIVLVTHRVQEKQMKQALQRMESQETTEEVACLLRVLES